MRNTSVFYYLIIDNISGETSRVYFQTKNFSFENFSYNTIKKYIFPSDKKESKPKSSINVFPFAKSFPVISKDHSENYHELKNFTIIHQKNHRLNYLII